MDFLKKSPLPRLGLDYLCTGVTGVWLDTERLWGSGAKPEVASFSVTPSPGPLTGVDAGRVQASFTPLDVAFRHLTR